MKSRYAGALIALLSVGAIAAPGVALASHGSDDPVGHVRHEHHRFDHHRDRGDRQGSDDGPNHRYELWRAARRLGVRHGLPV